MKDFYNISRYLPKKYLKDIEEINVDLDFDYGKNRSVQRYIVYFKDGSMIAENGIKNLKNKFKEKYLKTLDK